MRHRFRGDLIWWTPSETIEDFRAILQHNLQLSDEDAREECAERMCQFIEYLRTMVTLKRVEITVRDLLSWLIFINLNPQDIDVIRDVGKTSLVMVLARLSFHSHQTVSTDGYQRAVWVGSSGGHWRSNGTI